MSVTITSTIYWADWPHASDSTFEVRAKSNKAWVADDLSVVPAGKTRVVGTGSITALRPTIPNITLPATSAGLDDQTAKWTVTLHRTGRKDVVDTVLADFPLPSSFEPSATWAQIKINKNGKQPLRDTSVYTKAETNAQIALALGLLNYAGITPDYGNVALSVAPASPNIPIAVGDNDPRVNEVFNVKHYGAVCDRIGTAGTDDTVAVRAAIAAAEANAGRGIVLIPGPTLIRATSGTEILLISKGIILQGVSPAFSGLFASTDTPTTIPIVRYKPTAHPDNEGFTVRDLAIGSAGSTPMGAFPGAWQVSPASAQHCLVLDDSVTPAGAPIRKFTLDHCWLLPTSNGTGINGLLATANNANGCPAQSTIRNSIIYNGIKFPGCGDTVRVYDSMFFLMNEAVHISNVSGAVGPYIDHCNITSRGGIYIGRAIRGAITHCIIEMAEPDSVGSNDAVIDLDGGAGFVDGFAIMDNAIGVIGSSPAMDGVRINGAAQQVAINRNKFNIPTPKVNIKQVSTAVITEGVNEFAGSSQAVTINNLASWSLIYDTHRGARRNFNHASTAEISQVGFQEAGLLQGAVTVYGSAHATTAERNNLEITSVGGAITGWTNGVKRWSISATGVVNHFKGADVASAASITPTGNLFHVTGTTNIDNISTTGILAGTRLTLIFDGVLTVNDGAGNLKLAGNFTTSADDVLVVEYDGTSWFEVSRSAN